MKLAKGLGFLALVTASMSGCAVHLQEPNSPVSVFAKDPYEKPFATSPAYETANVELAPLRQRADDQARSLAAASAGSFMHGALPNAAAFSIVTPSGEGLMVEPAEAADIEAIAE
jgi:hypothetical protein